MVKSNKIIYRNNIKRFFFSVLLIVPIIIISCRHTEETNAEQVISGTPVSITHPFKTNLSDYIELNGNTVFLTKEILRSTFQGYVEKLYKNIGDDIKSGDDLFQIRTIESAAAESLDISFGGKQFAGTVKLKARSNGVLTELNYHQGDFVSNGEQLAIISNPSSMRIDVNVPFEDVSKVKIGNSCQVQLPGGEKIRGIIDKKIPRVDSATQTQTYFIKLDNQKQLPENLNISVKIPFRQVKDALVIPKNSIAANVTQDSFWVMKLLNDTIAVRVNVQKGIENDSLVQLVNTPLKSEDRVILIGAYGLPDTVKVDIQK